jgi:FkbH-like protein
MNLKNITNSTNKSENIAEIIDYVNSFDLSNYNTHSSLKINFLRNFTIEGIEPYLKYRSLESGFNPIVIFGNYDSIQQEVLDSSSHLHVTSPDIIVIALHIETYLADYWHSEWSASEVMADLNELFNNTAQKTNAIIAVNTFIAPFYSNLGIANNSELTSRFHETEKLNNLVRDFVRSKPSRFVLMDWERFIRQLGEAESIDYRFWYMSKAPFKKKFLDLYAQEINKVTCALKGKFKKCLVLDCDNTLWGGIIGEDGLNGIKLDRHTYPGNVYYEFQNAVLNLHKRGVLITICSKNNEQDVWDVMENHPYCLIKREHISAWRVNWQDKASNIKELATQLNIGLDSFVFVDDSLTECGLIRDLIPAVTVLQVPEKIYSYPQLLYKEGLFDTLSLTSEDSNRSSLYQAESARKIEQAKYETLEDYLSSLSLSVVIHMAAKEELARVAQLTQKTNQFNLTTRRYSEAQIESSMNDPNRATISLVVRDKFGDSGLTGVLIAQKEGEIGIIDNLLMSCRILGRNIETAFVLKSLDILQRKWKVKTWRAQYIKTAKNNQVANFWEEIGFSFVGHKDEVTDYQLSSLQPLKVYPAYITIIEE